MRHPLLVTSRVPATHATEAPRQLYWVAHGGASSTAPENTLAAFELAIARGADVVETDLHLTRDGIVVLFRDASLEHTSDAAGELASKSAAELARLDAGSWKDQRFAGQPIPTLQQAAELCRGRARLMLDIKVAAIAACARRAIDAAHFPLADLWVGSWNEEQRADARTHFPEARHCFIGDAPAQQRPAWARTLRERGYCAVSLRFSSVDRDVVRATSHERLAAFVWALDQPAQWETARALGVDGVITNCPPPFAPRPALGRARAAH